MSARIHRRRGSGVREIVAALAVGLIVFSASFVVGQTGSPTLGTARNPFDVYLKKTVGSGSHSSYQEPASFATPTSISIVDGWSGTPSTSVSPEVSIARVTSQNSTPGVPAVGMHFTKAGGTGGMEALSIWCNQTAAWADGQGCVNLYLRGESNVAQPFPSTTASWGLVTELHRWIRAESIGAEFDLTSLVNGVVSNATNASPIVITGFAYELQTGDVVVITGVNGNTAANGTWTVTRVNATQFSLDGSTGNGAYTNGGTYTLNATSDPTVGNGNRSIGVQIVGAGNSRNTAAMFVTHSTATGLFYHGVQVATGTIDSTGDAFRSDDPAVLGLNSAGAVKFPRVIVQPTGFTPTCASTNLGGAGTCVMAASSSDVGGAIVLTAAAGAASNGLVTLTFSTESGGYGVTSTTTVVSLKSATGTWDPRATAIVGGEFTTQVQLTWDNNGVALTNGLAYRINYHVFGR